MEEIEDVKGKGKQQDDEEDKEQEPGTGPQKVLTSTEGEENRKVIFILEKA